MRLLNKFCYNNWNIGFVERDIREVILSEDTQINVHWMKHNYKDRFFADPFLYSVNDKEIKVLVEDFPYYDKRGMISLLTVERNNYELIDKKVVLKQPFHMSYPFICRNENEEIWVSPEASHSGMLSRYQLDPTAGILFNQKTIMQERLLDSTIIKYNGKWWLFCTKRGKDSNRCLYVYYSDQPEGPYQGHAKNPVVNNMSFARPAGNMIIDNGILYRVSQECSRSYGEYINITKIKQLTDLNYEEDFCKSIKAQQDEYSDGLHTLNGIGGLCVVDGLSKGNFAPFRRVWYEFLNLLHR